eukprot:Sspe_Gene.15343::Locus_5342_Transcript_1_1_Confidence_1.000_Length_1202::g.15343::m.15343
MENSLTLTGEWPHVQCKGGGGGLELEGVRKGGGGRSPPAGRDIGGDQEGVGLCFDAKGSFDQLTQGCVLELVVLHRVCVEEAVAVTEPSELVCDDARVGLPKCRGLRPRLGHQPHPRIHVGHLSVVRLQQLRCTGGTPTLPRHNAEAVQGVLVSVCRVHARLVIVHRSGRVERPPHRVVPRQPVQPASQQRSARDIDQHPPGSPTPHVDLHRPQGLGYEAVVLLRGLQEVRLHDGILTAGEGHHAPCGEEVAQLPCKRQPAAAPVPLHPRCGGPVKPILRRLRPPVRVPQLEIRRHQRVESEGCRGEEVRDRRVDSLVVPAPGPRGQVPQQSREPLLVDHGLVLGDVGPPCLVEQLTV